MSFVSAAGWPILCAAKGGVTMIERRQLLRRSPIRSPHRDPTLASGENGPPAVGYILIAAPRLIPGV